MKFQATIVINAIALLSSASAFGAPPQSSSWRYYRPTNTGIQGDYCEAIWIGSDGDPWIGGYDASFEEGGVAKLVQAENRWINISNVDHPVIGHPNDTGTSRVSDIVADAQGKLWMATGRGALKFDPASGPTSLVKYDSSNSSLPGGWTEDVDIAPDGTLWFAARAAFWGGGGIARYNPTSGAWSGWPAVGPHLSAQPKPGGGYYLWNGDSYNGFVQRFDSATQAWTQLPMTGAAGEVAALPGKDCTDDVGNFWALRVGAPGDYHSLDYRRVDGTWVTPAEPYAAVTFDTWVFRAFGNKQALLVDGNSITWRFDGTSWQNLGQWRPGAFSYAADIDSAGNVWVSGVGGAARRDAATGQWQRYRVTNTSQYDFFNEDLSLDSTGGVYACANAGPGAGGMVHFDGMRWIGFNNEQYGLGEAWPFPTDNSQAVYCRPSNGRVAVNPTYNGVHEWNGAQFAMLEDGTTVEDFVEDSLGRLWYVGEYYTLKYHDGATWKDVGITAWGEKIRRDPDRPGTVWATTGHEIKRTDGVYSFSRGIQDFPELDPQSDTFTGLAVGSGGIAWVGSWTQFTSTGSTLIRLDANTGAYQMFRHDLGWPFPGEHVRPLAVTPDGRLWLQYDSEYPSPDSGLCWYDGTNVGAFPAPPGGEPQWGGLPHAGISDFEVRVIPGGYELWMICTSRGIAVLTVTMDPPGTTFCSGDGVQASCPCGNNSPIGSHAGCLNTLGVGATLRAAGTGSVLADDLVLSAAQMPANKLGLLFMGPNSVSPLAFGDGSRCVGAPLTRYPPQSSGPSGSFSYGPDLVAYGRAHFSPAKWISAGSIWRFQVWYRNASGPCGSGTNLTNGYEVTFVP